MTTEDMTPKDLVADLMFLFIALLHDDAESFDDARQWFKEKILSVESFQEAGVMSSNPGIRFQTSEGYLHLEITY